MEGSGAQGAGAAALGGEAGGSPPPREVFTTAPSTKPRPRRVPRSLPVHNGWAARAGAPVWTSSCQKSARYKPSVVNPGVPCPAAGTGGEFERYRRRGRPGDNAELRAAAWETQVAATQRTTAENGGD